MSHMPEWYFVKRLKERALASLLLMSLASCSSTSSFTDCWECDSAVGTIGSINSIRLYLCPGNNCSGLELEFVLTRCGLRLYLNVYGLEIPPEPFDCSSSRVFISFRDHSYHFSARRLLGGQRLLIPEEVQQEMLDYLQEGQTLMIQVDRYQADITANKFLDLFNKMAGKQL